MKTNKQVAEAFVQQEAADSGSLHSRGAKLYSYDTPIAYRLIDGRVAISTQRHSPTTTRHHSALIMALRKDGYSGCVPWPKIVAERGEPTKPFGEREGRSDPDSPAVVWQRHEAEAAD